MWILEKHDNKCNLDYKLLLIWIIQGLLRTKQKDPIEIRISTICMPSLGILKGFLKWILLIFYLNRPNPSTMIVKTLLAMLVVILVIMPDIEAGCGCKWSCSGWSCGWSCGCRARKREVRNIFLNT